MNLKGLIEFTDNEIRKEFGEYYIMSKSRVENIISAFENGAKRIAELSEVVARQQEDIAKLSKELFEIEKRT